MKDKERVTGSDAHMLRNKILHCGRAGRAFAGAFVQGVIQYLWGKGAEKRSVMETLLVLAESCPIYP